MVFLLAAFMAFIQTASPNRSTRETGKQVKTVHTPGPAPAMRVRTQGAWNLRTRTDSAL